MTRALDNALDEYLVLLAQGGSREAAERLVARWSPKLLAFAGRTLGGAEAARDAVQDTWESALRGLARLDDPARFAPWLYAIAARKCTDVLRAKYRHARIGDAVAQTIETLAPSTDDARIDLAAALKLLPTQQRVALSLFFGEDMSVCDIAAITGAPAGTVKSRLFAARQTLRKHFGEAK
ncbi:MAG: sigma-70 family RNA polymerase sigma factor [Hyphomonadaceae bacterium JAD_PAG50586_4]|nr:MAG: sigma-70 family RNA polymerase sigma factor [Hyphomonadaceae bacterium JAD_PAG50586_4]